MWLPPREGGGYFNEWFLNQLGGLRRQCQGDVEAWTECQCPVSQLLVILPSVELWECVNASLFTLLLLPVAPGSRRGHPISQMGKSRLGGSKGPTHGHRQVPRAGLRHSLQTLVSSFHARGCGPLGQAPGAPRCLITGLLHYDCSASAHSSEKWGVTRTSYAICQAPSKMRMQGSLLKERNYGFQDGNSRVLSPVQGPTGPPGSLTHELALEVILQTSGAL